MSKLIVLNKAAKREKFEKKNSVTALLTCEHWYLRKKILIIKKRKEKKEVEGRRRLCQIHYLLLYICECAQNFDYLRSTKFQQVINEHYKLKVELDLSVMKPIETSMASSVKMRVVRRNTQYLIRTWVYDNLTWTNISFTVFN